MKRGQMISEFCPDYCVRLNEEEPVMHQGCRYLEAVVMPTPYSAIITSGRDRRVVTVLGIVGDNFIVEEIMSNGQPSRAEYPRDKVKRS